MAHSLLNAFVALLAVILVTIPFTVAKEVAYCSSQNTGSDNGAQTWTWQSNGWCNDQCKGSYAFGVIQDKDCWCSNYAPADQTDTSDCNESCPGFPEEHCGNVDEGLFIYIRLDNDLEPSGTQGASKPTSAEVSSSSTPQSPSSKDSPSSVPQSTRAVTSDKPSSTLQTSTKDHSSSTPEPSFIISVITSGGGVVTQTVVFTPTSSPALSESKKDSPNAGAIAGGVIGGLVALAAIIGGVVFLLRRRRRQQREEGDEDGRQSGVQRNTSTMSKSGLLQSEKIPQYPPQIHTNIARNSRIMGDSDSISPVSGSDKRSSRPYIFDQRLNPSAIMTFENASRGSFASMDDSRDYGRTLNVRNPDPH